MHDKPLGLGGACMGFITGQVIVRHLFSNKPIPYLWRLLMQLDYVKNKHQRRLDKTDDFCITQRRS